LETAFWDTLEEIAARESMSLDKFLTKLHRAGARSARGSQQFRVAPALFMPDLSVQE
jgi:predicted DNA-binding ribbon-helix-helix protein